MRGTAWGAAATVAVGLALAAATVAVGLALATGAAAAAAAEPRVAGPEETVYDWDVARCATWDIPDAPARAWRAPDGGVRLAAGSERTRAEAGPTLDALTRDCAVLVAGAEDDDPAAYDDRLWLASILRVDGARVEALGHMEFHGHERREICPTGDYSACWWNAIVALTSDDGGRTFRRDGLVAALPYRFDGAHGSRMGYFNPSNAVERDGHLYAFVFAEAYGAQRRGVCLLRRPVAGGAADWRAWDGAGFGAAFADPYGGSVDDPSAHVCAPLPGLSSTLSSVVVRDGRFLAVTPAALTGPDGARRAGIWWTTSDDLLRWSAPAPLIDLPLLWRRDCAAEAAYAYPSLLDPDAATPAFADVDDGFWLYLTRLPLGPDCKVGPERDLVRYPVSWPRG
jgi:hypothetical protein